MGRGSLYRGSLAWLPLIFLQRLCGSRLYHAVCLLLLRLAVLHVLLPLCLLLVTVGEVQTPLAQFLPQISEKTVLQMWLVAVMLTATVAVLTLQVPATATATVQWNPPPPKKKQKKQPNFQPAVPKPGVHVAMHSIALEMVREIAHAFFCGLGKICRCEIVPTRTNPPLYPPLVPQQRVGGETMLLRPLTPSFAPHPAWCSAMDPLRVGDLWFRRPCIAGEANLRGFRPCLRPRRDPLGPRRRPPGLTHGCCMRFGGSSVGRMVGLSLCEGSTTGAGAGARRASEQSPNHFITKEYGGPSVGVLSSGAGLLTSTVPSQTRLAHINRRFVPRASSLH